MGADGDGGDGRTLVGAEGRDCLTGLTVLNVNVSFSLSSWSGRICLDNITLHHYEKEATD